MHSTVASSNSYAIVVCMPSDSLLLLLRSCEPEVALVLLVERATAPPSVAESARALTIIPIWSDACILWQPPLSSATSVYGLIRSDPIWSDHVTAVSDPTMSFGSLRIRPCQTELHHHHLSLSPSLSLKWYACIYINMVCIHIDPFRLYL